MVVFVEHVDLLVGVRVTTDFDRTSSKVVATFSQKFDPGQEVTESILGFDIQRIGGFLNADITFFVNNQKIGSNVWPSGFTGRLAPEFEDIHGLLKFDGTDNKIEIQFRTGGVDGFNEFFINSVLIYNGNTELPPDEPPDIEPPIIEEGSGFSFLGITDPITVALLFAGGALAIVGVVAVAGAVSNSSKAVSVVSPITKRL